MQNKSILKKYFFFLIITTETYYFTERDIILLSKITQKSLLNNLKTLRSILRLLGARQQQKN